MFHQITTVLLMPVLIPQAIFINKMTVSLPEPTGERLGVCGAGNELKLLIIGDSAALGVGVDGQEDALAGQLSSLLGCYYSVSWQLLAKTGATAEDVLVMLQHQQAQVFDVVLVSIGVNDVTHFTHLNRWEKSMNLMLNILVSKFSVKKILLSNLPPMQEFTSFPLPLRWWWGQRSKQLNNRLTVVVKNFSQCTNFDIDAPIEPRYIAKDGFHPSKIAYQAWANQAAKTITSSLDDINA
ncbi:SGNH/GDSL hydrolase family protein [Colwellia sp. MB02u-10]|uniref:SGNH/GDSL hydrolase family protein n=1 Tax=Colwellia sp. MB02u-10 TaxID=2759828 RepID=UPI0015F6803F|nr:SGNH/GDSL hydrolase family protein [Colwellia sp. MB02u-10]MBA6341751.1 SGNH/GDSL hydrolase family protein [Colwellia sp. MB02u-10]